MFRTLVATALVATTVIASPSQIYTREDPNSGLTWIYKDKSLPKVMQVESSAFISNFSNIFIGCTTLAMGPSCRVQPMGDWITSTMEVVLGR